MSRRTQPPYALVLATLVAGYGIGSLVPAGHLSSVWARTELPAMPRPVDDRVDPLPKAEMSVVEMFETASQSVVFIATSQLKRELTVSDDGVGRPLNTEIPDDIYGMLREQWLTTPGRLKMTIADGLSVTIDPSERPEDFDWDSGSGIVWDQRGHLLTNYHVVRGAWTLMVRLPDLSDWPATVVGFDEDKDLAVLRIDAPPERLYPARVGSSHDLRVGQRAYSIGNPFGLSSTLTEGIISAVGRTIRSGTGPGRIIQGVIQTDAAINPGNSGGPLLDSSGRLIGVTTAMVSETGSSAGIGFAVPIDTVNRIIPDLINYGRPTRAGLGVQVWGELSGKIDGVMVASVLPGSAADRAGLRGDQLYDNSLHFARSGDIIVAIDDEKVKNFDDLYRILDRREAGEVVRVHYRRGEELHVTEIELQLLPAPEEDPSARLP